MRSPHWPRALGLASASRKLWVVVASAAVVSAWAANVASTPRMEAA